MLDFVNFKSDNMLTSDFVEYDLENAGLSESEMLTKSLFVKFISIISERYQFAKPFNLYPFWLET